LARIAPDPAAPLARMLNVHDSTVDLFKGMLPVSGYLICVNWANLQRG
jgi:hypothetical protein